MSNSLTQYILGWGPQVRKYFHFSHGAVNFPKVNDCAPVGVYI